MPDGDYDLAIVGAGAAGLIAARFAARLGARVLLAERDRIGGDCTWTGCVPSKSLIRVAKAAHEIQSAARFGIAGSPLIVDMPRVRDYVQRKVQEIYRPTSPEALAREGIDVLIGETAFKSDRVLVVGSRDIVARRFLICTGASPVAPAIAGLADVPYFTYQNIFDCTQLPKSLAVIGGGPLGAELAQAFRRLGSVVTIVAPKLLPRDDADASGVIERVFEREGIYRIRERAASVHRSTSGTIVTTESGSHVTAEALLVAAGRRPNVDGLGLDRARVEHSARGIPVDDRLRTNIPHIYAAGDVLGREQFSHIAGWQAFQAARNALLPGSASGRPNPIAWTTFTDPEVAHTGVSEADARQSGGEVHVSRWDLARIDRARCDDDEDGFIKLIAGAHGRLVGATIVAARAGELSGEISLAVAKQLTVRDLAASVHAYPTYATALEQMASEMAVERWTSSSAGRLIGRLLGFRR